VILADVTLLTWSQFLLSQYKRKLVEIQHSTKKNILMKNALWF